MQSLRAKERQLVEERLNKKERWQLLTEILEGLANEFRGKVKVDVRGKDGRVDPVVIVVSGEAGDCVGAQSVLGNALFH